MIKYSLLVAILWLHVNSNAAEPSVTHSFSSSEWPKTDFSKHNISFDEILSGGPPKDGIPAIDKPIFIENHKAMPWLNAAEPVISLEIAGIAKAYPLQILMYHEIVNDEINGQAISVTFCPLCNTSIVFSRDVNQRRLDFGTTGRLRNSDLIMYDRQTQSWWQQFTGEAIIGEYTGTRLIELTSQIVSFQHFQKNYPKGLVLSRQTGFKRSYGTNPYRGYDHIDNKPFLMRGSIDGRLPPMERVLSVKINQASKLYPFSILENTTLLQDNLADTSLVIFNTGEILSVLDQQKINRSKKVFAYSVFSTKLGNTNLNFQIKNGTIKDQETNSEWDSNGRSTKGKLQGSELEKLQYGIHFAFAWLAFNPNVEIYQAK